MLALMPIFFLLIASITGLSSYKLSGNAPRKFFVAPSNLGRVATSAVQFLLRGGSGAFVKGWKVGIADDVAELYSVARGLGFMIQEESSSLSYPKPAKPIELYEFEGCPFCKKVREAVSILDIDVLFLPCPQGGPTFRPKAIKLGGKKQFPYMVDPNTKRSLYESDDIIKYLFETYSDGVVPESLTGGFVTTLTCGLGLLPRAGRGSKFEEGKPAKLPIVYWGYEGSPFCKIVRERLVELEIPHIQKSCARGSPKRQELLEKTGTFQVPFIEDPNTGVNMFESADILEYLDREYSFNQL